MKSVWNPFEIHLKLVTSALRVEAPIAIHHLISAVHCLQCLIQVESLSLFCSRPPSQWIMVMVDVGSVLATSTWLASALALAPLGKGKGKGKGGKGTGKA